MNAIAPLHQWRRHHPTANAIAEHLCDDLLALRTRRLQADIQAVHGVGACTARTAVAIARRRAAQFPDTSRASARGGEP